MIGAVRQPGGAPPAAKEESGRPGSPIGQRQVSSVSSSKARRWPIGMTLSTMRLRLDVDS